MRLYLMCVVGRSVNLRKFVVALCMGGRGGKGRTVDTMWGVCGAR